MRLRALIFLLAVSLVAVAGVAFAAMGGSKKVTLCAAKGSAALSAPKDGKCGPGERKLTISTGGVAGKAGPAGSAGPTGAPGPAGTMPSLAASALNLAGTAGPDCAVTLVFCSGTDFYWVNYGEGYAPVGYRTDANGVVHLQGAAKLVSSSFYSSLALIYLPPGLRPQSPLTLPARSCAGTGWARVYVEPDGAVRSTETVCIPLDGISFQP
jgi:hypothetical protein